MAKFSVLFVCLGNICRSPTAEAVFRYKAKQAGLIDSLIIDSAGTSAHHQGEQADPRSQKEAAKFGYDLSAIRSRQVSSSDFINFDLLLAMDFANLQALKDMSTNQSSADIKLFLADFAAASQALEVPDPYYGGQQGFINVIKLIEQACDGLINYIKAQMASN